MLSKNPNDFLDETEVRLQKLHKIESTGEIVYKDRFTRTHQICELDDLELDTQVSIAGRIILKRSFGKLIFAQMYDINATHQISLSVGVVSKELFDRFIEYIDIGDFIGVHGVLYRTKIGELTVGVDSFELLSKSLRPLPEKYHGLNDQDTRYRQRYLDLISNEPSRNIIKTRFRVMKFIRDFYHEHGFVEVETPVLQNAVGGALAKPFRTHHNSLDLDMNLRISPETFLKRTLASGFDRVFEVAKNFRNEGISSDKLQEFTMIESYAAYWNFEDSIDFYTKLFREVVKFVFGKYEFTTKGRQIVLNESFSRMNYVETLNNIVGFNVLEIDDVAQFKKKLVDLNFFPANELEEQFSIGGLIDLLYKRKMRPAIIEPTILYNYPNVVPLARFSDDNTKILDMFQLVINSQELVKGYSELINPIQQETNFKIQQEAQNSGDGEAMDYDREYLLAMEHGFPPCSGIGFGIDVFLQVILDCDNIRETILYPIMRPLDSVANKD